MHQAGLLEGGRGRRRGTRRVVADDRDDGRIGHQLRGDGCRLLRVGLGVEVLEAELLALHSAIGVDLLGREFEALLEQPAVFGVLAGLGVDHPDVDGVIGRPRRGRTRRTAGAGRKQQAEA
ncbi:hypothetical protein SDC9_147684 [bioreactor metagenome]|uniref:Uncharacterized protein n=1 Tax=bioreactor metagenome TaxID=1076179 RepID=A0A645EH60_9ZZZZ